MSVGNRLGSVIEGYRLDSLIGRGGMGLVYLAEDLQLKRKVVVKLLAPELAEDQSFRQRFVRESQLAASLDHPNILPIYQAGHAEGVLFIAMRYVPGTDLRLLLRQEGHLDPRRAIQILTPVARALDAAHASGLVHRDVKPGNILIAFDEGSDVPSHVYLADFGLVKRTSSDSGLTAIGKFVGSLQYSAPEQIEGKPVDTAIDIYALGCVLFECLTGEVPYPLDDDVAVMFAHVSQPPPRPTAVAPQLPAGFDLVVATAMAKRKEERYPTCLTMMVDASAQLPPGSAAQLEDSLREFSPRTPSDGPPIISGPLPDVLPPALSPEPIPLSPDVEPFPPVAASAGPPVVEETASSGLEASAEVQAPPIEADQAAGSGSAPTSSVEETILGPSVRPLGDQGEPPESGPMTIVGPPHRGDPDLDSAVGIVVDVGAPAPTGAAHAKPPALTADNPEGAAADPIPALGPGHPVGVEVLPPASPASPRRRVPPKVALVGAFAVAAAIVIGVVLISVSHTNTSSSTHGSPSPSQDSFGSETPLTPNERITLVTSDTAECQAGCTGKHSLYIADPTGRVFRLDGDSLEVLATVHDPSLQAIGIGNNRIFVSDGKAVTRYRSEKLIGELGVALNSETAFLAGGTGDANEHPLFVATSDGVTNQLCVVGEKSLEHCLPLDFTPTGLGADKGSVWVADGAGNVLFTAKLQGGNLVRGVQIEGLQHPSGTVRLFDDKLYVPEIGGVAVVPANEHVVHIRLGSTPSSIAIAPTSSMLFAALPNSGTVARVDVKSTDLTPHTLQVGDQPVAVGSPLVERANEKVWVYVADARDHTIYQLDPTNGQIEKQQQIDELQGTQVQAIVAGKPIFRTTSNEVTMTVPLGEGIADSQDVVVKDDDLGDGTASFQLWQGRVTAKVTKAKGPNGVTVSINDGPSHLSFKVTAKANTFTTAQAVVKKKGDALMLTFKKPAAESPPPTPSSPPPPPSSAPPPRVDPPASITPPSFTCDESFCYGSHGSWSGNPTSYNYVWFDMCDPGGNGAGCVDSGERGATVPRPCGYARLEVTATNEGGSDTAYSAVGPANTMCGAPLGPRSRSPIRLSEPRTRRVPLL